MPGLVWGQNTVPVHPNLAEMRVLDRVPAKDIRDALKKIDSIASGPRWLEGGRVKNLYARRDYQPLFVMDAAGLAGAQALLDDIAESASHGLPSSRYAIGTIDSVAREIGRETPSFWNRMMAGGRTAESMALLDALIADRYLAYALDLQPKKIADPDSPNNDDAVDSTTVLGAAPADSVTMALARGPVPKVESWAPTHPQYVLLRKAWTTYRKVVTGGGWPLVDTGETLKPLARGARVEQVRARLDAEDRLLTGESPKAPADPKVFDSALIERVRHFQAHHDLDADGAVGKGTVAEMNVSAADRLRQIEVSLARWRQGPRREPGHRVEVNIPGMMVTFYHGGTGRLSLRTVVGSGKESAKWKGKTSKAETPELVDEIETIEVNPRWYIPEIIVRTELLQKEKKKPGFLDKGGYEWYDPKTGKHGPASEIPEADWSNPAKRLNLRQKSGAGNSLGKIKFVFHNRFAVYLHDTPEKNLFKKGRRNFSHGCVRVENPSVLAESLLAYSSRKAKKPLKDLMADTARVVITLKPPVPIHLVYRTAWVEDDGSVDFLPDIYGKDSEMEAILSSAARASREPASFTRLDAPGRHPPSSP